MRLRIRGRWGVQAGIVAGIAVAAFFFIADLVRMSPLATPLFVGRVLVEAVSVALEDPGARETLTGLSLGGRLAAITAVHLAAWGALGIVAAALANLFRVRWTLKKGAVLGGVVGAILGYGAATAGVEHLSRGLLTPELVLAANTLGGAVLGWFLQLRKQEAEDVSIRVPRERRRTARSR